MMNHEHTFDTGLLTNYSRARKHILPRLVNLPRNAAHLHRRPHTDMADLAVIYDVLLYRDADHRVTAAVTNSLLSGWQITKELLHADAVRNMSLQTPPCFKPMQEVLLSLQSTEDSAEAAEHPLNNFVYPFLSSSDQETLFILSNESNLQGAAAVLDHALMQQIAARFPEGFYILPSSVHELLIVSKSMNIAPEELETMVQEINACEVAEYEQLSDHVYEYDMETQALCPAGGMKIEVL